MQLYRHDLSSIFWDLSFFEHNYNYQRPAQFRSQLLYPLADFIDCFDENGIRSQDLMNFQRLFCLISFHPQFSWTVKLFKFQISFLLSPSSFLYRLMSDFNISTS